jgi:hypothetical protein
MEEMEEIINSVIVFVIVILAYMFIVWWERKNERVPKIKFEYSVILFDNLCSKSIGQLYHLGKEGWELMFIYKKYAYFKRETLYYEKRK